MKRKILAFLICLSIFPLHLFAQNTFPSDATDLEINTNLTDELETIFQNIDKNRIPYGMLKDATVEFTELDAYDGSLTDSSYVHPGTLKQIYKTLLMSRMRDDVSAGFVQYDDFINNWQDARAKNIIVLSGAYFKYGRYKTNAHDVTVSNNKVYDKYITVFGRTPMRRARYLRCPPVRPTIKALTSR